ncbi:unnamed protein product [Adineta ricciae]|uniref:Uncharacterized protein n=1 Tax=Adineta ricciae TaxID=249248 RepID=A0A816FRM1_ADIRI|nr:unnamed protein product [Adineta ricciae]
MQGKQQFVGPTDTPFLERITNTKEALQVFTSQLAARTIMGRLGQTTEIAKTVLFVASDDSLYITGSELFLDGGAGQI